MVGCDQQGAGAAANQAYRCVVDPFGQRRADPKTPGIENIQDDDQLHGESEVACLLEACKCIDSKAVENGAYIQAIKQGPLLLFLNQVPAANAAEQQQGSVAEANVECLGIRP